MKNKMLSIRSIIYIYIYTIVTIPNAWALSDATSFSPEQIQVQAQSIGVPIGTVIVWTKEQIPDGWLECDGQKVNEVLYPELAALMPNTPNYKGRFLQGLSTGENIGKEKEAGLPNIWGKIGYQSDIGLTSAWNTLANGAFALDERKPNTLDGDFGDGSYNIRFDASRCSPVYGKSTTVQPPSVTVKFIIKAE